MVGRLRGLGTLFRLLQGCASSRRKAALLSALSTFSSDELEGLLRLGRNSYLTERGWLNSQISRNPTDASGRPLPWLTFAALELLDQRVQKGQRVFEFGAGFSTVWWRDRGVNIVSVEGNRDWLERVRELTDGSTKLLHFDLFSLTPDDEDKIRREGRHDIVVVDDGDRNRLLDLSRDLVTDSGIIILDNSERPEYQAGIQRMTRAGYRHLEFSGMGPVNTYGWSTSLFYRPDNIFGF